MPKDLNFFATESFVPVSKLSTFRDGRIYGQDVSSGFAVAALMSDYFDDPKHQNQNKTRDSKGSPAERVLDLCCAPGLKLCAIADLMEESGTVVGVDIAEPRLHITQSIIQKYQLSHLHPRIRVYCCDGTQFGRSLESVDTLFLDSQVYAEELKTRKRKNKSARRREEKKLKLLRDWDKSSDVEGVFIEQFSRVLVDAECSTDGSFKHLQKQLTFRKDSKLSTVQNNHKLDQLVQLQRQLANNGYRLLQNGGVMVYATCSLSTEQNEGVVNWLLSEHPTASIVPLYSPFRSSMVREGGVIGTLRFLPNIKSLSEEPELFGGGFFVAKIQKATNTCTDL